MEQDKDNFAPRAGFVWTAAADGRTVVRGGYGHYFDQGFNNISGNISNSARSNNLTVLNPGYPDPFNGGTIQPTRPSITVAAPELETPVTRTASLGARRELQQRPGPWRRCACARSASTCSTPSTPTHRSPALACGPTRDILRVLQYQTTGRSWSDALLVSFERRTGRGPLFNVSYTLSRQTRNVEDFGFTPADSFNPGAEKALANNNRTHQLVTSVVWALPWGVQASGLLQTRSGLPWTVTTGAGQQRRYQTSTIGRTSSRADGDPLEQGDVLQRRSPAAPARWAATRIPARHSCSSMRACRSSSAPVGTRSRPLWKRSTCSTAPIWVCRLVRSPHRHSDGRRASPLAPRRGRWNSACGLVSEE